MDDAEIVRAVGQLWLITGSIRRVVGNASRHERIVYLEHPGFPTERLAEEALLHNWSSLECEVEVQAIQKSKLDHPIKLTA